MRGGTVPAVFAALLALASLPSLGCESKYATAATFAGAAGALEAAELAGGGPSAQPPCGRPVLVCPGGAIPICQTDGNGCQLCSCRATPSPRADAYDPR
jgi:hypothetical protein